MNVKRRVIQLILTKKPLLVTAIFVGSVVIIIWLAYFFWGRGSFPERSFEHVPALLEQAPCVADVCVGDVGRTAVFEKLSQSDLLYDVVDNGGDNIWFAVSGGLSMGVIFAQDEYGEYDVVERFNLQEFSIPFGMLLQGLGEPDDLFLMFGCGQGVYIHSKLFYREKGIEVQLQYPVDMDERTKPVVFNKDMPSAWIWYFDPDNFDKWLLAMKEELDFDIHFTIAESVTAESLVVAVQPWPGMDVPVQPLDLCTRR